VSEEIKELEETEGLVHEERRPEIRAKLKRLERKLRMSPDGSDGDTE
jgi:hypothetical protein